jgi:hypothetical protein
MSQQPSHFPTPSEHSVLAGYIPPRPTPWPITRYLCCLLLAAVALAGSLDCAVELIRILLNSIVFTVDRWHIRGFSYYYQVFLTALPVFAWLAVALTAWRFRKKRW